MKSIQWYALALSVFVIVGCSLFSQIPSPTAATQPVDTAAPSMPMPLAKAAGATSVPAGPTQDTCAPAALRTYLQGFAAPMSEYELALIQVYNLETTTNGGAASAQYSGALSLIQTSRDTIAAMPTPDCAKKLQAATLSGIDHMLAGIKLKTAGASQAQFEPEFTQEKADQKTMESEFAALSAKAGLNAAAPTP